MTKVFVGNFPVNLTRIDLWCISKRPNFFNAEESDNFKGDTYDGECTQVDEKKLLGDK